MKQQRFLFDQVTPILETAKAIKYCLKHWGNLTNYLNYSFLTPDTNAAERAEKTIRNGKEEFFIFWKWSWCKKFMFSIHNDRNCKSQCIKPKILSKMCF